MSITYEGATEEIRQVIHHHAVLRRGLERHSGALCEAVENGVPFERLMTTLREYMASEILPHANAEERTLYQAAATRPGGTELVRALTAEHHALAYLAGRLRPGTGGTEAVEVSEWIATLFAAHVAKVNDHLLPALARSGADLAGLLAEMRRPPPPSPASACQPEAFSQP
jgi:hemerythrin HHE cation binding domain-containing protein